MGNTIGFYDQAGTEVGSLNPDNGEIKIYPAYSGDIKINVDLSSHMPTIKIVNSQTQTTLFQINLPTQNLVSSQMNQGIGNYTQIPLNNASKYGIFDGGSVIQGAEGDDLIYVGPQGQIYIPTPYNNTIQATYSFDKKKQNIIYQFSEKTFNKGSNNIDTISVKFKPATP